MYADLNIKSVQEEVSAEEWQLRVELAACYRLVALHGWDDLIFTHISVRVPGPEHHFLINPYGMQFEEITASSLVKIDCEGEIVANAGPFSFNKAGFVIHSAIHMARDDAQCVIHLHTPDGVAVSAQKDGLLGISQHALLLQPHIAYHHYEGVAFDTDERSRLVNDLGDKRLFMLRNHGTLAVGRTCAEAFMGIFFLEKACSVQVRALTGEINWPDEAAKNTTWKQGQDMFDRSVPDLAWSALMRKLDRIDPSFKQ